MKSRIRIPPILPKPVGVGWIALAIAATYGFIGALWIGFSDQFVARLGLTGTSLTRVQQYKGWGYVVVTAVLLYLLLRVTLRRLEQSLAALHRSRDRLQSLNRLYRMVRAVKGAMLREPDPNQLLAEACRVAVTEGGYRLAWVAMRDPDGRHVRAVAHAGAGENLVRRRVVEADALPDSSPVGRALRRRKPVFANRCRNDPILDDEHTGGAALGYGAVAAIPIFDGGDTSGCLAVYASGSEAFDRHEARLLIELGDTINLALSNLRHRHDGTGPRRDEVTGLPDRRMLEQRLEQALERAHRRRERVALAVLDIDDFRRINDTLGRRAGDRVLRRVAGLLVHAARSHDAVARLGNDEFAVVLTDLSSDELIGATVGHIADCFPQRLSVPDPVSDQEIFVSVSIGVAVFPGDAQDVEELFGCAELALHSQSKDAHGQVSYYEPALNERARRQRELDAALRSVEVDEAFHLAWQPVVEVGSGRLVGAEALIRWEHPRLGMIAPDVFIPLAELSGQIFAIGHWVLAQAIGQGDAWARTGLPLNVHINVSLLQLQHPGFVDELAGLLGNRTEHDWTPVIEITESQLMADPDATASSCEKIRDLGCRIELDDFGTGYSALNYLTRIPLDGLKLDRSFVVRAETDPNMRAVVGAVVKMAQQLGLVVVAEGVETRRHLELLRDLGCDRAQGYLFGRPQPAADLAARWRRPVALAATGR